MTPLSHPALSLPCSETRFLPVGLWALASHFPPSRPATGSWFYPGPGHLLGHCPEESWPLQLTFYLSHFFVGQFLSPTGASGPLWTHLSSTICHLPPGFPAPRVRH